MPIYEFYSPERHKVYSFFARSASMSGMVPRCPDGEEFTMRKLASRFAFVGRAREKGELPEGADDIDDPRMEAALAEMEREMAGIDDENPDPRQLGRMMRRMAELSGEPVTEPMEEMMRRLEGGEDPEMLEEEFGDAFGDDDAIAHAGEGAPGEAEPAGGGGSRAAIRRLRQRIAPRRDPKLYEMSEYL